jgi:hypothetical protein
LRDWGNTSSGAFNISLKTENRKWEHAA